MPHLSRIVEVLGEQEVAGVGAADRAEPVLSAVLVLPGPRRRGLRVGVVIGMLLALAMQRLRVVERAMLPYVVLSQTVPLIALAPLVYGWSGNLIGLEWEPWMSVSAIAAYLAFFPVAIGALRGLSSPTPCRPSCSRPTRPWWQTLLRLRLPASVAYLIPALKLAAAARRRRDRRRDLDRA